MASRLYRTTRALYLQVMQILAQLGVAGLGSPTLVALIGLYVAGLILLDGRQTQTRVTRFLPARCHDALNRLLRVMPLATRPLMALLVQWVKRQKSRGYLCLDSVIVEKAYAHRLLWAGWTYSLAQKRSIYGLHIVVWLWCSLDGRYRIPIAFRLWRPKASCPRCDYQTKVQLAARMLRAIISARVAFQYIVFDTGYTAGWFTKMIHNLGSTWVGTLQPRTNVVWHGRKQSVAEFAAGRRLKWRKHLGLRASAWRVYAPGYGMIRLVVTRNSHGNYEYLASNDLAGDLETLVRRKRGRWSIETIFRDSKQFAGLNACQSWVPQAMVRHVALVLLTFTLLQLMRVDPQESVGSVKERWQLAVLRNHELAPQPLKACPLALRSTA